MIVKTNGGFSLVELMLTCAIASLLATMAALSYDHYIYKARVSTVVAIAQDIEMSILVESETDGWTSMTQLTGSTCTGCAYGDSTPAANDVYLQGQWAKIGITPAPIDPWGTLMVFDENEGEGGPMDCRPDMILSAGPNHKVDTWGTAFSAGAVAMSFQAYGDDLAYYFKHQRMPDCNGTLTVY
jgi:prepilin-type N-terminal cleavage/methylation domain-containing protein